MTQPTLFDAYTEPLTAEAATALRARATDPATSHVAAQRASKFAGRHGREIWYLLVEAGKPLTCHEIADMSYVLAHRQIHKRMKELETAGFVIRCETRRCCCLRPDCKRAQAVTTWRAP